MVFALPGNANKQARAQNLKFGISLFVGQRMLMNNYR